MAVTYDPLMVLASVVVAVMASFTGLRLVSGLDLVTPGERRVQIAKAAFALGGGVWSMHFIGMLAVRLPFPIGYDALYTLGSALIAILITGFGLSMMHVGERTLVSTVSAGTLTGLGIVSMHYVGMRAISANCLVVYHPAGFFVSSAFAVAAATCALALGCGRRTLAQLSLGAVILGITIAGMHYSAMAFTRFLRNDAAPFVTAPVISDDYLALIVALAAFVVCGLFLLTALPLDGTPRTTRAPHATDDIRAAPEPDPVAAAPAPSEAQAPLAEARPEEAPPAALAAADHPPADHPGGRLRVPYEHNGATFFLDADRILAIKAEGHYTRLYDGRDSYFCPWSISRLDAHLAGRSFVRTHRSFLVNLPHAGAFKREKDKAYLIVPALEEAMVPVSRFHVAEVRRALGL